MCFFIEKARCVPECTSALKRNSFSPSHTERRAPKGGATLQRRQPGVARGHLVAWQGRSEGMPGLTYTPRQHKLRGQERFAWIVVRTTRLSEMLLHMAGSAGQCARWSSDLGPFRAVWRAFLRAEQWRMSSPLSSASLADTGPHRGRDHTYTNVSQRQTRRLRRRDYSRPLASEPDVKVSLHPAQASQRPCEGPVSSHRTCWLHDTTQKSIPLRGR